MPTLRCWQGPIRKNVIRTLRAVPVVQPFFYYKWRNLLFDKGRRGVYNIISRGKIMKLQVEQAKEHIGKKMPFSYTVMASELGDVTAFPWSHHDITISGEFWFDGQNYIVTGTVYTEGDYECTRCLAPVHHSEAVEFEEIYRHTDEKMYADDGNEGAILFDGETIDLTELIRDTLIINEPSQVLCQEDCKGLCVQCGANLNVSPCSCESFVVDPRLAALRALLDEKDDKLS